MQIASAIFFQIDENAHWILHIEREQPVSITRWFFFFCVYKFLCLAKFQNTGIKDSLLNICLFADHKHLKLKVIIWSDPVLPLKILMAVISLFSAYYMIIVWQTLLCYWFIHPLEGILFCFFIFMKHTDQKELGGKKRFNWFTGHNFSLNDTKAETKTEIIEECSFSLWCFLWLSNLPVFYSQRRLSKEGTDINRLSPSTLLTN